MIVKDIKPGQIAFEKGIKIPKQIAHLSIDKSTSKIILNIQIELNPPVYENNTGTTQPPPDPKKEYFIFTPGNVKSVPSIDLMFKGDIHGTVSLILGGIISTIDKTEHIGIIEMNKEL